MIFETQNSKSRGKLIQSKQLSEMREGESYLPQPIFFKNSFLTNPSATPILGTNT